MSLLTEPSLHYGCVDVDITFSTSIRITNVGQDLLPCIGCEMYEMHCYLSNDATLDGGDELIAGHIELSEGTLRYLF